jgi:hypothetical protein
VAAAAGASEGACGRPGARERGSGRRQRVTCWRFRSLSTQHTVETELASKAGVAACVHQRAGRVPIDDFACVQAGRRAHGREKRILCASASTMRLYINHPRSFTQPHPQPHGESGWGRRRERELNLTVCMLSGRECVSMQSPLGPPHSSPPPPSQHLWTGGDRGSCGQQLPLCSALAVEHCGKQRRVGAGQHPHAVCDEALQKLVRVDAAAAHGVGQLWWVAVRQRGRRDGCRGKVEGGRW